MESRGKIIVGLGSNILEIVRERLIIFAAANRYAKVGLLPFGPTYRKRGRSGTLKILNIVKKRERFEIELAEHDYYS